MSQKKMFEVKCTSCKKTTTVPFEPTKGKPVYCKPCFAKRRTNRPKRPREPIRFDMSNAWASRGDDSQRRKQKPKSVFKR
jgi:CxxC-x17-CxxC domain-containing protein